jgi:hypothetical protein
VEEGELADFDDWEAAERRLMTQGFTASGLLAPRRPDLPFGRTIATQGVLPLARNYWQPQTARIGVGNELAEAILASPEGDVVARSFAYIPQLTLTQRSVRDKRHIANILKATLKQVDGHFFVPALNVFVSITNHDDEMIDLINECAETLEVYDRFHYRLISLPT